VHEESCVRILVTGAAGFIGWNLTRELRHRHPDAEIVGVDNLWTGRRRNPEYVSRMVVRQVESMEPGGLFDYVYHLASPASPVKYQEHPIRTVRANVDGLWRCLFHCLMPKGTIFFASSSEVYGDPLVSPQPESYKGQVSCTGIRACYDESKRLCETILCDWKRIMPTQGVKIARLFNVYGPGTLPDDGRCMSNFIWQAMQGKAVEIYGDGHQTRCFTYVDNVVNAICRLTEETPPEFVGPVNIGTDVESTVRDIAVLAMGEVGRWHIREGREWRAAPAVYRPAVEDDPRQRLPDLALAREMLGWDVRRLIKTWGDTGGVARTIRHFAAEYWDLKMYVGPTTSENSHKKLETQSAHLHNDTRPAEAEPAGDAGAPARVDSGPGGALGAGAGP
jgi:nucleoside-diphosphate-sugar epimerase